MSSIRQYLASGFVAKLTNSFWPDTETLRNPTEYGYVSGQSCQANSQDTQQSTSRPNAYRESPDLLFATPRASLSASSFRQWNGDSESDAENGRGTAETSSAEYSSPVHLARPWKNKPPLSSRGRRAQAVHRVKGRAREDGRKSNRFKRRRQSQVADSDSESTWDNGDKYYSPLHMKAAQTQHKRCKVSSIRRDIVSYPVRHTRKSLANRGSSRRPAADSGQATYEEWPVHKASRNRVIGSSTAQHQFDRDLLHQYRKRHATLLPDREESDTLAQETIESEEELYDVEEIVNWAWDDDTQQMEYLIKWEGYDSSENTWEPLINLTQCQAQLAQFHCRCEPTGPRGPEERA